MLNPELDFLTALLRDIAATEIMPRFHCARTERKADGSLVTATDLAVQTRLVAALDRAFPGIPLLGEEMSGTEQARLLAAADQRVWVLDPLDGTSNYALGFPGFAISLALIEQGRTVLGIVFDPVRDECFTAARGQGARLNGEPLRPVLNGQPGTLGSDLELSDCLAMIDLKRLPPAALPALFRPGGFRSQRNLGSVALDWCWLAAGRFQLYLHGNQRLWDYAAGRLIADETGVPSRHYQTDGVTPARGPSLEPRLAVAAMSDELLERWLAFLDLPWRAH